MRRFHHTREFFVPSSYHEVLRDDDLGVELHSDATGLILLGFSGKRQKPDFHVRFGTVDRVEEYSGDWLSGLKRKALDKQMEREARKAAPNPLKAGDVLRASWGYEQTNIDYYEVIDVIGKRTVLIQEIASLKESSGDMTGTCVPRPGHYVGEAMRKIVDPSGAVKVQGFGVYARKKDAQIVAGMRVFETDSWTAYA